MIRWQHGTYNGYLNKGCKCDPCRAAGRNYAADRRAQRMAARVLVGDRLVAATVKSHGTPGGYSNHGCRCVECSAAHAKYIREYRRKKQRI